MPRIIYYAYKLQIRPNNFLLRTTRLFQQWIVDTYIKLESTRLDYLRNNQSQLRAELYEGILDTMASGEREASNVGRRIVHPPSGSAPKTPLATFKHLLDQHLKHLWQLQQSTN